MIKSILFLTTVFAFPLTLFASSSYMDGDPSTIMQAVQTEYGADAGFGASSSSCTLCHTSASGGLGTMNSTFGEDFLLTANELHNGGSGLTQTQLQSVLTDSTFADEDSDSDGTGNGAEMTADTDPSTAPSAGGDAGGCGMISAGTPFPPTSTGLMMLLPLLMIALMYRSQRQVALARKNRR